MNDKQVEELRSVFVEALNRFDSENFLVGVTSEQEFKAGQLLDITSEELALEPNQKTLYTSTTIHMKSFRPPPGRKVVILAGQHRMHALEKVKSGDGLWWPVRIYSSQSKPSRPKLFFILTNLLFL